MVEEDEPAEEGDSQEDQTVLTEPVEESPETRTRSELWDTFATYSITEDGVTYKIIPQFTSTETRWTLWIFGSGQGPIQRPNGISDEIAGHLGLSPSTQRDLNATLKQAQEEMELPSEFRGQPRGERSLGELKSTLEIE